MPNQLVPFLNRVGESFANNWYHIRDVQDWMLEEIYRKRKTYPYWRKKVLFSYVSWKKNHPLPPQFDADCNCSNFFYHKFDWLFRYFVKKLYSAFEESQLELQGVIGEPHKINSDLFLDYRYYLTDQEINEYKKFKFKFNIPDNLSRTITYMLNMMVLVFDQLMNKIIKQNYQITMISAKIKTDPKKGQYIHFLIVGREIDYEFFKIYIYSLIFNFAEILPKIDPQLLSKLRLKKNRIIPMALREYPRSKKMLATVLFTLQKKIQTIEHITPLLDILNFIASRVEDSVFDTEQLVEQILIKKRFFPGNPQLMYDFKNLFKFINEAASLFSTFQSNNRANIQRQYQLFFFYSQYFCAGGIKNLQTAGSFYFPHLIAEALENSKIKEKYPDISSQLFTNFIFRGLELIQMADEALNIVFKTIFKSSVNQLNENFFEAYLISLNAKFIKELEILQKKYPNAELSFSNVVHILFTIMYNLVEQIFLADEPAQVQDHFKDKISRYTPEKISLRVLELRIFKEIPLSDNNWQDYFLSRNKDLVKKIFADYYQIPESYFFSAERLLKINMMYERALLEDNLLLEEWIIPALFQSFYDFQNRVRINLPKKATTNQIATAIFDEFSRGVLDTRIRTRLEELADYFAKLWV